MAFPNKKTQFSSTNQPKKNGRKKKIYTILKEQGYNADDMKASFKELAFYDLESLKIVYNDNSKPIIVRIVANQFFQCLKSNDWNKIKDILEHVIGKPTQKNENDVVIDSRVNISVQNEDSVNQINKLIDNND